MITAYHFEAMPIIVTPDGYDAGALNGSATIDYGPDRNWSVTDIEIEVSRVRTPEERRPGLSLFATRTIPAPEDIARKIRLILLNEQAWKDRVQRVVDAELRQQAAEDAAFQRGWRRSVAV